MRTRLIIHGDCLQVLPEVTPKSVRMAYIDPPFNTGSVQKRTRLKLVHDVLSEREGFGGKMYRAEKQENNLEFQDKFDDYEGWLMPRIEAILPALTDDGSLFVHLDYREVHYIKVALDKLLGRDHFMNEIIWSYDYGGRSKTKWPAKHDTILWYAKDPKKYVFNFDAMDRIPYLAPGLVGPEKAARGKTPTAVWNMTIVPTNSREKTGYPCLRPGSRVLTNEGWLPIEEMQVGMQVLASDGTFCEVEHVSNHHCGDPLVRLAVEGALVTVDATSNHPFLVWREGEIAWVEAGQIRVGDYSMTPLYSGVENGTQKPCDSTPKDIFKPRSMVSSDSSTLLSGSKSTALYLKDSNSTTATTTSRITICPISNLLTPLHTSGFTLVVNSVTECGGNHAGCAVCSNPPMQNIGTCREDGLTENYVDPALSLKSLTTVVFALHRVESVDVVPYSGEVWNLSVEGNPTFQTEVGMSHNTQKPLHLLNRFVRVHTNPGDVVLDAFAGSGTLGESAAVHDRDFVLIDASSDAVHVMKKRLEFYQPVLLQST